MQRASANKRVNKKVAKVQKRAFAAKKAAKGTKKATAFAPTKVTRRIAPQWSKAQSPFAKSLPQEFVDIQNNLDGMWREVYAAPKEVQEIDFAFFDSKIKNKPALTAIKTDYQTHAKTFKVVKSQFQSPEAAEAKVKAAEGEAVFMADTAKQFKNRITQLEFASTVIPFLSLQEEIALTPGLEQEFDRQMSNYWQVPDETVIKALDIDISKIQQSLDSGSLPEIPAEGLNKIMFTPIYFAAVKQHEKYRSIVQDKYKISLPTAQSIMNASLKRQGALPTMEQVNEHLDAMELPFILTALPTGAKAQTAFNL